ncbi:hypothetical protein [Nocardia sp. NPDC004722]
MATVSVCALVAFRVHRDPPATAARHSRDRYSVAAIRARIENENAGTAARRAA